jgi:integrase
MPNIPTEKQTNTLIAGAGKTLSLKLWTSKETALRPIELHNLKVRDINTENKTISPITSKHGAGRVLKISETLTNALQKHIIKNDLDTNDKVFRSNAKKYGDNFRQMRNSLAKKLNQPELKGIRLYDIRHYALTMKYWQYRDTGLTAQDAGHKDWNTTRKYIHLCRIIELMTEDGYICKIAQDIEQAKPLIEAGFEYQTGEYNDGGKLFRKHK